MDMGNSPATIESARLCDFYGCLKGHMVSVADALGGNVCWINLPREAWPVIEDGTGVLKDKEELRAQNMAVKQWNSMRNPMTILLMALYGHPDSVTMWEVMCDLGVKSVGFSAVGAEWPSVYYHKELKLLLIIYVDDFKLAGPEENLEKGWALLRTTLTIGPEGPLGMYLGCNQQRESMTLYDGGTANVVIYDMTSFLSQ